MANLSSDDGVHDRMLAKPFLQPGSHDGERIAIDALCGADNPFAPRVAQTADMHFGMQRMHKNAGALAQHIVGRGHVVGDGQKLMRNPQQNLRVLSG